jgi:uncharacterized protein with ATP-grasp and redox domains
LNIDLTCVECIINQSKRVGETLKVDEKTAQELINHTKELSKDFSFLKTPPEVATPVYKDMAKILKTDDIYLDIKQASTKKALSFLPVLEERLLKTDDKFTTALKIAVAGNVIDLASEVMFDLQKELDKIFELDFDIDDSLELKKLLENAKEVVVLGDNVGEHLFDKLFIEILKELYQNIKFYYFVRGEPIINDVTLKEAKEIDFDEVCEVVDSGVPTPGFVYNLATPKAKELFDRCDVVISKGMGNYECLSPSHKSPIAFLLKVKCSVVASSLFKEVGDIVCKVL